MTVFEHPDESTYTIAGCLWPSALMVLVRSRLQPAEMCSASFITLGSPAGTRQRGRGFACRGGCCE